MTKMRSSMTAAATLLAVAGYAIGAPRESVTFTAVNSQSAADAADNTVLNNTFVGGYQATAISVSGTLTEVETATWASEARIRVTDSAGAITALQPMTTLGFTGSISIPAGFISDLSAPDANSDGSWTFRFFESYVDSAGGTPDATWDTITFTLDDRGPLVPPAATFVEVEPNDSKAAALAANNVQPGNTFGGVISNVSADYFKIKAAAAPAAIYRNSITFDNGTVQGDFRGLTQTAGVPNAGTDASIQLTTGGNVWYGFGKGEEIYWRVASTTATAATYVGTVARSVVTPVDLGTIAAGDIGVAPDTATANALDTDWIVYDGNFNPVPTFQHDDGDATVITRTLGSGTYYIAGGRYNTCNDQGAATDDTFQTGSVLDFPNAVVSSSTGTGAAWGVSVTNAASSQTLTGSWSGTLGVGEVAWFKFTIGTQCIADVDDGSGTGTRDGGVDISDLLYYLGKFSDGDIAADVDNGTGTGTTDGGVDIADLLYYLQRFSDGC